MRYKTITIFSKKYLLLFLLVFALSACSRTTGVLNENNAPKELNNYNDKEVVDKLNELRAQEPAKNSSEAQNQAQTKKQSESPKVKLADLAKEYNGVVMKTNMGDIKIKLYTKESPLTVNNFLNLAQKGFYDGTKFHRVISNFMIQGGDPNSKDDNWADDGTGGPGYKFPDEFNDKKLVKGSLAMANSGPNTNGSQFFIVTAEATPWLDGKHTNFGEVVSGLDVVMAIEAVKTNERDHPLKDVTINSIELTKIN